MEKINLVALIISTELHSEKKEHFSDKKERKASQQAMPEIVVSIASCANKQIHSPLNTFFIKIEIEKMSALFLSLSLRAQINSMMYFSE